MQQVGSRRRRTAGASAVIAVLAMLVALLGPVGTAPAPAAGQLFGYRLATETDRAAGLRKGHPVPGSEWGFTFSAKVVSSWAAGPPG